MEITISCEIFSRLSNLALSPDCDDKNIFLKFIRLENINGNLILISTNSKLSAIERFNKNSLPNFIMDIIVEDALINQIKNEVQFGGNVHFFKHGHGAITARTDFGYSKQNENLNADLQPDHPINHWRKWFPDKLPTETNGGMFAVLDDLRLLALTAPTGSVIFPEFIDNKKPVMVQDHHNPDWIGLFMPNTGDTNRSPEPFSIPSWVK